MTRDERERWQQALVAYGQQVVAALAAEERVAVSSSLLRNHSAHLEAFGGTVDDLVALVQDGWRRAWETHSEGVSGFLGDVQRAWTAAARDSRAAVAAGGTPRLAALIRCALCPASVHSQRSNVDSRLLAALLDRGIWSPAQVLAHLRVGVERAPDPSDESLEKGLAVVAPHLDAGQAVEAMELAATLACRDHAPTIEPWLALARRAIPARLDDVELLARSLAKPWSRCEALVEISGLIAVASPTRAADLRAEAIQILRKDLPRPWAFLNLATRLAPKLEAVERVEVLAEACAIAEVLERPDQRASYCAGLARLVTGELVAHIAIVAARAGCADPREDGLGDALELVLELEDKTARAVLDEVRAAGRSGAVARWLGRHESASVARRWTRLGELLEEDELAQVGEAWLKRQRQRWLDSRDPMSLQDLVDVGFADAALAIARESPDPRWRDAGLGYLAVMLPIEERVELLARLLARDDAPEWAVSNSIAAVADERPEEVFMLLSRAAAPVRASVLTQLADRAEGEERARLGMALGEAARELEGREERLQFLNYAQRFSGDDALFRQVCDEIAALPARSGLLRKMYLEELGARCTPAQRELVERLAPRADVLDEHMQVLGAGDAYLRSTGRAGLSAIRRSDLRARGALRLAELLAEGGEQGEAELAIEDALRAAREISDAGAVCGAAASLRPYESTRQALLERARQVADPVERFRALCAVWSYAERPREAAQAAALDAAEEVLHVHQVRSWEFFIRHAPPTRRDVAVARFFDDVRGRGRELAQHLAALRVAEGEIVASSAKDFSTNVELAELQSLLGEIVWALSPAQAEEALNLIPHYWTGHVMALLQVLEQRDATAYARQAPMRQRVLDHLRARRGFERGGALARLAHCVPSDERASILDEALAEASVEGGERAERNNQRFVLHTVAPLLDETHVERILPLALEAWRERVDIHRFVTALPERLRGVVSERLFDATKTVDTHDMLIAGLAAHLPDAALSRVLEAVERKAKGDSAVLGVVLVLVRRCQAAQLLRLLELAADFERRRASRPDASVRAIASVGAELLDRSPAHAPRIFEHVDAILRERARTRGELLDAITALAPVLRKLAGPDECDALAREILEVSSWWP